MSVTRLQTRLYDAAGRPVNPKVLLRTQDLPPPFEENSEIYVFTREQDGRRFGDRPLLFETGRGDRADFALAEALHHSRRKDKP